MICTFGTDNMYSTDSLYSADSLYSTEQKPGMLHLYSVLIACTVKREDT